MRTDREIQVGTRTLNEAMVKGFLAIDFLKARRVVRRPQFRGEEGGAGAMTRRVGVIGRLAEIGK